MNKIEIYEFYAELRDFEPRIWRRFKVNSDSTIAELAYILLTMFEMKASHLFKVEAFQTNSEEKRTRFMYEFPDLTNPDFAYNNITISTNNIVESKLREVLCKISDRLALWYDFGDDWFIDIKLENTTNELNSEIQVLPKLVEGSGYGIIEDCGGPMGLKDLCDVFKDKSSIKYEEYSDWLGMTDFNIKSFDKEEMEYRITRIPAIYKRSYEEKKYPTDFELDFIDRRDNKVS